MSKERARLRAERERQRAAAAAARERREARIRRRREMRASVRAALPRRTRWARHQGLLARRRRAQNIGIAVAFVGVQAVVWAVVPDWSLRLGALGLSVLLTPVVVTLIL